MSVDTRAVGGQSLSSIGREQNAWKMSSDKIFVTQSTMRDSDSVDTDGILSDVLDVENNADKANGMYVQVKSALFPDMSSSDAEVLAQTTQEVERNLQKD
jgi:hypothetical protein